MYIERKAGDLTGDARIGRVTFSKTMRTMYYNGKEFLKVSNGFKRNCIDIENNEEYWISGCKKNGADSLYGCAATPIDEDVKEEYWITIRERLDLVDKAFSN